MLKLAKRFVLIPVVAGTVLLTAPIQSAGFLSVAFAADASAAAAFRMVQLSGTIVTSGVRQLSYARVPTDPTQATEVLHMLEIDLTNPYVQLNAMIGQKGSVTAGQSVGAMVRESGAVAGINGDVFGTGNEGAPIGATVQSGRLLTSTATLQGMYAFGLTADRQPIIDRFGFIGGVTAANGAPFALAGINQAAYRTEPGSGYSHVDKLYMYTSAWTAPQRPSNSASTPFEALVVDGIVTEVSQPAQPQIATPIPVNGYILRGHAGKESGNYIVNNLPVGSAVNVQYRLESLTKPGTVYDPAAFRMMVSGHTLLLDEGKAVAFTRDINGVSGYADRARTAVGYSKDGKTAYLLTVEENGTRAGVSLKELQDMLVELGVWKAVNLDGGGSTTLITRPLGEFQTGLAHATTYGATQRQVANGIGVYTTAPQGDPKGIVVGGPGTLFIGEQAAYSLKAYDTFYNPLDPTGLTAVWSVTDGLGAFKDGVFTAEKPGTATLSVKAGEATGSLNLEVVGAAQIERLIVEPATALLQANTSVTATVKAQLKDGRLLAVPASSVKWEFHGINAGIKDGKIAIGQVPAQATAGYAVARYDGLGAAALLTPKSEITLETFENVNYKISFNGTQMAGSVKLVTDRGTSRALLMTYDGTAGSGKRYANAVLNDGKGIAFPDAPGSFTIDVLGDGSLNWLRAEFVNGDGKPAYVDMAKKIDWTGWKNLRVDLTGTGLKGDYKLNKLYIVNLEEGQDERALVGELAFDNLKLQYATAPAGTTYPSIVMNVGKTAATVDGQKVKLPGAPFIQKGTYTTYLPLRFVADTLGASIAWDNKAKRVTVLRGTTMLELWVTGGEMAVNGTRKPAAVAPILKNGSVYVPVRLISEQLGQKVSWESKTQTITIR